MRAKINGRTLGTRPPAFTESPVEPLSWLAGAHQDQLALCDSLEAIADSLPDEINRGTCAYAAKMIGPMIRDLHAGEERLVFAWIKQRFPDDTSVHALLERLKYEHCEDECFAEELTEMLGHLGAADRTVNAETAGYMLRGFFTNVRRHIRFEQECLRSMLVRRSGETPC
ncbi:hemerythrin domain-containing protein [Sinorhizobium psoraleae]|uniref:Hemerythrin domain-containing protein n=1 Tax=Sinorhizobium psoraleae TaxID=520838 RepID=A0ABT4KLX2_9HYPH|nr:hemerythrin domain-containing protein [Sinorhizobium psoraleae]MCZ4092950.1 hemerythrin domain-containing protein [Sinorhizobium psoraleae]